MENEQTQRLKDAEEHQVSYEAIMRASIAFGVPFSLALAVFFTSLVMVNGLAVSFIAGIVTYIFVYFVGTTFFSH